MNPDIAEYPCTNCTERLGDFYIECAKCDDLRLCLECFSCGAEFSYHERIHPYRVKNAKGRSVFSASAKNSNPWNSAEEIALLEAVERYNLGNWDDVVNLVNQVGNRQRTTKELRDHYDKFYIRGKIGKITRQNLKPPLITDCSKSLANDSSQQQTDKDLSSKVHPDDLAMLCYMPSRDDFEKEYNNDAENIIANLAVMQDDDDELDRSLKLAQIDSYVRQLAERQRRKSVIQEHDLISEFFKQERPQMSANSFRYTPQVANRLKKERDMKESLRKFAQFSPATDFNDLISSIIKQSYLKERIEHLQHLQKKGVKTLQGQHKTFQADVDLKRKRKNRRLRFRIGTPRDVRRWQHMRRWQKRWLGGASSAAASTTVGGARPQS